MIKLLNTRFCARTVPNPLPKLFQLSTSSAETTGNSIKMQPVQRRTKSKRLTRWNFRHPPMTNHHLRTNSVSLEIPQIKASVLLKLRLKFLSLNSPLRMIRPSFPSSWIFVSLQLMQHTRKDTHHSKRPMKPMSAKRYTLTTKLKYKIKNKTIPNGSNMPSHNSPHTTIATSNISFYQKKFSSNMNQTQVCWHVTTWLIKTHFPIN